MSRLPPIATRTTTRFPYTAIFLSLAAMRAFDGERVPAPVAPLIAAEALDVGDRDLGGRGISLGIVPDEQLTVLLESDPCPRLGQRRNADRKSTRLNSSH